MKDLDDLYERVSAAIIQAESELETQPGRREAFLLISDLEDQIATLLPADELEGAIARRGAIRAAVRADDLPRAGMLLSKYLVAGVPDELAMELLALTCKEVRVISQDGHRALMLWQDWRGIRYALQKWWQASELWKGSEWDTEFELHVRFDGCAEMMSKSDYFHMCEPEDADALARLIKACMADTKERIG